MSQPPEPAGSPGGRVPGRAFRVRALGPTDRDWLEHALRTRWGASEIVTRGRIHQAGELPGFVAVEGEERLGCVTYALDGEACEVVSLDSFDEGRGVGGALLAAVQEEARRRGAARVWLITTHDNLKGLGFYQRRGYRLRAVHAGAVDEARRLKPSIPEIGLEGIPIHDEIELELMLG